MRKGKKSFNPFTMWLAYVLAVIFGGFSYLGTAVACALRVGCGPSAPIVLGIGGAIFGFLVGWGIHSLIRFLRR